MSIADFFHYGRKVNNYIEDATSNGTGNDKFESTTLQEYTVPAAKRWLFLYGCINRDVSSTVNARILDSSGKVIAILTSLSAGTGLSSMVNSAASAANSAYSESFILDAGEQLQINFGTAQSTAASISCVVLEVDI